VQVNGVIVTTISGAIKWSAIQGSNTSISQQQSPHGYCAASGVVAAIKQGALASGEADSTLEK